MGAVRLGMPYLTYQNSINRLSLVAVAAAAAAVQAKLQICTF
jgi:hypothetical protein